MINPRKPYHAIFVSPAPTLLNRSELIKGVDDFLENALLQIATFFESGTKSLMLHKKG